MEGYIGFENYKDNKLRLEVGRLYTRRPVIGGKLSFFDNPLDVLRYYPPCDSGYSRVKSPDNKADKQGHHVNTSELRVIEDMGLGDIAEAAEKIIREGINTSKSIVSEKNRSVAVTTKKGTEAIVSGDQSVAISIGWRSKAKGALGCWLVLAECRSKKVIDVKSTQVDGDRIKVNTFYRLKNGEFVECKGM